MRDRAGLIEAGCTLISSYPDALLPEILESAVTFAGEAEDTVRTEWSINEKVAYEIALGHSYTGNARRRHEAGGG